MEGIIFNTNKPDYDIGKIFLAGIIGGAIAGGFLGFKIGQIYSQNSTPARSEPLTTRASKNYDGSLSGQKKRVYCGTIKKKSSVNYFGRTGDLNLPISVEINQEEKTPHSTYTFYCSDRPISSLRKINLDALEKLIKEGDQILLNDFGDIELANESIYIHPDQILRIGNFGRSEIEAIVKN